MWFDKSNKGFGTKEWVWSEEREKNKKVKLISLDVLYIYI